MSQYENLFYGESAETTSVHSYVMQRRQLQQDGGREELYSTNSFNFIHGLYLSDLLGQLICCSSEHPGPSTHSEDIVLLL